MVADPNALIHPWTVVIMTIDTPVTYVAVMGVLRSQNLTSWAYHILIEVLVQFQE